jgi:hypothetical protein
MSRNQERSAFPPQSAGFPPSILQLARDISAIQCEDLFQVVRSYQLQMGTRYLQALVEALLLISSPVIKYQIQDNAL